MKITYDKSADALYFYMSKKGEHSPYGYLFDSSILFLISVGVTDNEKVHGIEILPTSYIPKDILMRKREIIIKKSIEENSLEIIFGNNEVKNIYINTGTHNEGAQCIRGKVELGFDKNEQFVYIKFNNANQIISPYFSEKIEWEVFGA